MQNNNGEAQMSYERYYILQKPLPTTNITFLIENTLSFFHHFLFFGFILPLHFLCPFFFLGCITIRSLHNHCCGWENFIQESINTPS